MKSVIKTGAFLVLSLSLGCVTAEPLRVELTPLASTASELRKSGCAIHIAEVMDGRTSNNDLGSLGSRLVQGSNVVPWVRQAIERLAVGPSQDSASVAESPRTRQLDVKATLKKLYVHSLQSSMGATILLAVHYRVDQGSPQAHMYRGTETGVSWTGSAASVADLLNTVMDDVIERMRADLEHLCQGPSSAG